jgi:hypothetical protein
MVLVNVPNTCPHSRAKQQPERRQRMSTKIWEISEADLIGLIKGGQEESLNLEYKGSQSLVSTEKARSEISKDTSAFANSEGGALVYGVSKERSGNQPPRPRDIDQGIDPTVISKEWIENVINSRIQRRINGVKIHQVPLTDTRPGRVAYVVWVPQSYDAPHQAYDKRYYKRFNFQSVPMEDYEIRDVRNRHAAPIIDVHITSKGRSPSRSFNNGNQASAHLSILIQNTGAQIAQQVYLEASVPESNLWSAVCRGFDRRLTTDGIEYLQLRYHHRDAVAVLPLFPGTDFEVLDGNNRYASLKCSSNELESLKNRFVYWTVYADHAEPRTGKTSVHELLQPF